MAKKDDRWIEKATKNKGAFHKATGTPAGKKISAKKEEKAEHSRSGKVRKEASLYKTLAKVRPK